MKQHKLISISEKDVAAEINKISRKNKNIEIEYIFNIIFNNEKNVKQKHKISFYCINTICNKCILNNNIEFGNSLIFEQQNNFNKYKPSIGMFKLYIKNIIIKIYQHLLENK